MNMTECESQKNDGNAMRQVYARRRERLRPMLRARGLDALLVSHAANRYYLSGFELHDPQPDESSGRLIISVDGNDWLATDSRYMEAASEIWPAERVFIYRNVAADLRALLEKTGTRIGFEPAGISWDFLRKLKDYGDRRFGGSLEPASGLVEKLREIKEPCEIEALKASFRLNHKMLAWLEEEIASGNASKMNEKELSWAIERFFRENGAQELAFANIVASGASSAMPHAVPRDALIGSDGILLADVGCRVNDYCSDQTRSFWTGAKPDARFLKTMTLVRKAQDAALAMMRPGVRCEDVFRTALKVFEKAGEEKAFIHGLGHGVGLQTHEAPSLSNRSEQILEEGMAVTVEPGLYYPGWGGIRWEYTVLVEKNGVAVL